MCVSKLTAGPHPVLSHQPRGRGFYDQRFRVFFSVWALMRPSLLHISAVSVNRNICCSMNSDWDRDRD